MLKAASITCLIALLAAAQPLGVASAANRIGQPLRVASAANRIESLDSEITDLVDRISESVVSIAAVSRSADSRGAERLVSRSVGTGVIFDKGGLILTTASVVGYAARVEVGTAAGETHTGEVVGIDPATDLAVISVEELKARPAHMSEKRNLLPGSIVFVIGNSYGRLPSVSMGVISNAPAPLGEDGGEEMIRMSVPVNPGNTGAPIVSSSGEVIGLLVGRLSMQPMSYSMRIHERGFYDFAQVLQASHMSVALPAYRLRRIAEEIIEKGTKRPGFLGVRVVEAAAPFPEGTRPPDDMAGVVVTAVVAGSPAESIGLEAGDIIWKFGASDVLTPTVLREMVSSSAPGSVVTISFIRGSDSVARDVRIASRSPEQLRRAAYRLRPEEIDMRIKMIQHEIDRMEKELERLEEAR
jgi:S1-C subfamily serine protease